MNRQLTRRDLLKLGGGTLASACLLGLAGCAGAGGGASGSANKTLVLGNIGWTENIAVSNLTKILLEEDLGYKEVELKTLDVGLLFEGVAGGDLHAFQDVWMPNHKQLLAKVENDIEHLKPWYQGQTSFGLAVPDYMDVQSIADLNDSGAKTILGIEPGAVLVEKTKSDIIPEYNLDLKLQASSTAAMLSEMSRLYPKKEPFVFMAWSPHWMNQEYEYHYLEDPKNAQGNLDQPAKISTIVNEDLPDDDPVAYAFLKALRLDENQVNEIENEMRKADDQAVPGIKTWLKSNRDVVQPWIKAAKQAQ